MRSTLGLPDTAAASTEQSMASRDMRTEMVNGSS